MLDKWKVARLDGNLRIHGKFANEILQLSK